MFYSSYGTPDVIKLNSTDRSYRCLCQLFVEKCMKTKRESPNISNEEILKLAESELMKEGISLKPRRKTNQIKSETIQKEQKSTVSMDNLFQE